MVRVLWCCYRKLDKDLAAGVFYIRKKFGLWLSSSRENLRWRFNHRKVLLNWQTVCVFICC